MRAEDMALRSEIRQMLTEAGLNRDTIKQLVRESLNDIIKNQVNQVLMEHEQTSLKDVVAKNLDNRMDSIIKNVTENVAREKLRGLNFNIDVQVTTKTR